MTLGTRIVQGAFCPGGSRLGARIPSEKCAGKYDPVFHNRYYATDFQVLAKASLGALRSAPVDSLRIFGHADPKPPTIIYGAASHDRAGACDQEPMRRCVRAQCAAADRGGVRGPCRTQQAAEPYGDRQRAEPPGRALGLRQALVSAHGRESAAAGGHSGDPTGGPRRPEGVRGGRSEGVGWGGGGLGGGTLLRRLCEILQKGCGYKKNKDFVRGGW